MRRHALEAGGSRRQHHQLGSLRAVRFGSAASSIVFGEKFGPLRLAGMLTVVGGIAVMVLAKRPEALPKEPQPKAA